jgi:hypothetical protein
MLEIFVPRIREGHIFVGKGQLLSPEGDILWEDPDWIPNALHDAGEQSMLSVYLKEQANPSKYLALLNDASIAETDGTMAAVTETKTPATGGYDRQAVAAGDWTDDGLVGGDYRFSAAEKTFGPITTASATVTHAALTTTLTSTSGLLLLTVALSATTTVAVNQFLKYVLRWSQS